MECWRFCMFYGLVLVGLSKAFFARKVICFDGGNEVLRRSTMLTEE